MTPELWVENWLPFYPLAGDTKGVAYPMSRERAIEKQFIQLQGAADYKNVVSLDIDSDEAALLIKSLTYDDHKLPEFNWLTVNPLKNTAQVGYFIDGAVGTTRGLSYHKAIETGLSGVAGSDGGYTGFKGRNPLYKGQVTEWGTAKVYTLAELGSFVEKLPDHFYKNKKPVESLGRNTDLFNDLKAWSYRPRNWRNPNFDTFIMLEAQRINQEFDEPLPYSELVTTANSVKKWVRAHFSEEEYSRIQSYKSRLYWGTTKEDNDKKFLDYYNAGFTAKEVAELEGKSVGAVRTATRRARGLL
jgi:hypothetical protein